MVDGRADVGEVGAPLGYARAADCAPDRHPPRLVHVAQIPQGAGLRIPTADGPPWEAALSQANAAARQAALDRLDAFFPGYDFAEAAQNVDDRRLQVLPVDASLLDHLAGAETVDRLVTGKDHVFDMSGVTFSCAERDGHQPPPPGTASVAGQPAPMHGWLQVGGLTQAFDEHWTTILNGIDRFDPALGGVCDDLSAAYAARVNTNAYLSHGPAAGFGPHWDSHDTIIVQVHGRKRWAVYEPLVLSAQRPWIDGTISGTPVWEGVLEPGLALVIPRGWGHEVLGSDSLTIHYTIGIDRLEVRHLFERVAWEGGYWPALRADVPFDLGSPPISYQGSVFDEEGGFAETVAEVATDEMVRRAVASFRARIGVRRFPSLTATFRAVQGGDWDGLGVRLSAPVGVVVAGEHETGVVVAFDDTLVTLDRRAIDAFVALAAGGVHHPQSLPAVGLAGGLAGDLGGEPDSDPDGDDGRLALVRDLVHLNLATVEASNR